MLDLALQVTIEILGWIQLWRLGRQVEDLDAIAVLGEPFAYRFSPVDIQSVEDQDTLHGASLIGRYVNAIRCSRDRSPK